MDSMRNKATEKLQQATADVPRSNWPFRKRWIVVAIILVIVMVLAGGGFLLWQQNGTQSQTVTDDEIPNGAPALTQEQKSVQTTIATTLADKGPEEAAKELDAALQSTRDDTDKSFMYTLKIAVETAKPSPNYDLALTYAVQADDLNPTFETALNVGELAYQLNKKDVALKYYKLYLERSIGADGAPLDAAARPYYEARVAELEG